MVRRAGDIAARVDEQRARFAAARLRQLECRDADEQAHASQQQVGYPVR